MDKSLIARWQNLAAIIHHTNLRPEATPPEMSVYLMKLAKLGFGAVMVNRATSHWRLRISRTAKSKFETREVLKMEACEIDMVFEHRCA